MCGFKNVKEDIDCWLSCFDIWLKFDLSIFIGSMFDLIEIIGLEMLDVVCWIEVLCLVIVL